MLSTLASAEGDVKVATLRQMFAMDGVVTLTNTSLGLAAALVLAADARALPILLIVWGGS